MRLAVPDADRTTLKQPSVAAIELADAIADLLPDDAIAGSEAGIVIAADKPVQRSVDSKLLHVDAAGRIRSVPRSSIIDLLRPGDVVVANDAATLPASLRGVHVQTGAEIEVRLAARDSLAAADVLRFDAIVFGSGDHRTRTEDRAAAAAARAGSEDPARTADCRRSNSCSAIRA